MGEKGNEGYGQIGGQELGGRPGPLDPGGVAHMADPGTPDPGGVAHMADPNAGSSSSDEGKKKS